MLAQFLIYVRAELVCVFVHLFVSLFHPHASLSSSGPQFPLFVFVFACCVCLFMCSGLYQCFIAAAGASLKSCLACLSDSVCLYCCVIVCVCVCFVSLCFLVFSFCLCVCFCVRVCVLA